MAEPSSLPDSESSTESTKFRLFDYYDAAGGAASSVKGGSNFEQAAQLPSARPPLGLLPDNLPGRKELKETLNSALDNAEPDGKVIVLHGIAGGGKSAMALWSAHHALDHGLDVYWVRGTDVRQSMLAVAAARGVESNALHRVRSNAGEVRDMVWDSLDSASQPWLLVFDNVDDLRRDEVLGESGGRYDGTGWIRASNAGTVLVTTRHGDQGLWGGHAVLHRVDSLGGRDGAEVLVALAPGAGTPDDAVALSTQLGGLPLALRLAGSYLSNEMARYRTFAEYRAAVRRNLGLLDAAEPPPAGQADDATARRLVQLTWELTLRLLDDQGMPLARSILRLLTCYGGPHPVPLDLLVPERLAPLLGPAAADLNETALDVIIGALRTNALVDRVTPSSGDGALRCVVLHPLLADVVSAAAYGDDDTVWGAAAELLREFLPDPTSVEDWPRWSVLPPLHRHLLDRVPQGLPDAVGRVVDCANQCSYYLLTTGALRDAHEMSESALRRAGGLPLTADRHQSEFHLEARFMSALVNGAEGNSMVVCGELEALLSDARRALPESAPFLVLVRQQWAQNLLAIGLSGQAEAVYRELIGEHARGIAPELEIATRFGYGRVLANAGRFREAEQEIQAVYEAERDLFGGNLEHPDILVTRATLADLRAGQGQLAPARDELAVVLRAQEELFGPDSPRTLATRMVLIGVHNLLRDQGAAGAQLGAVLRIQRDALNPEHPLSLIGLAALLTSKATTPQDDTDPAVDERRVTAVADTLADTVGEDNILVLNIRLNAAVRRCVYDMSGGRAALDAIVERQIRLFGRGHPTTLSTRLVCAQVMIEADADSPAAESQLRELLHDQIAALGDLHPQTVDVRTALANITMRHGNPVECTQLLHEAVAASAKLYGAGHEHTWEARGLLVTVLCEREEYQQARQELIGLIAAMDAVEPNSLNALAGRVMLALVFGEEDRPRDAENELRIVLAQLARFPDEEYGRQVVTWLLAAAIRTVGGRHDEVERLLRGVETALLALGAEVDVDFDDDIAVVRTDLGEVLHERGKFAEAEAYLQLAMSSLERLDPDGSDAERARRGLAVVSAELAAKPDPVPPDRPALPELPPAPPELPPAPIADRGPDAQPEPVSDRATGPDEFDRWLAYLRSGGTAPGSAADDRSVVRPALAALPPAPAVSPPAPPISPELERESEEPVGEQVRAELALADRDRERSEHHRDARTVLDRLQRLARADGLADRERAMARHHCGEALADAGFPTAAVGQFVSALAIYDRHPRRADPDRSRCLVDAVTVRADHGGDRQWSELAAAEREIGSAWGAGHDLTLRLRRARAVMLAAAGRLGDARAELDGVLAARAAGHHGTGWNISATRELTTVRYELAAVLERAGDPAGAARVLSSAAADLGGHCGADDRQMLAVRAARAAVDGALGLRDPLPELRAVLACQVRRRGFGHPDTATTRVFLARAVLRNGDIPTAARELRLAAQVRAIRLGTDHPATRGARDAATELAHRER